MSVVIATVQKFVNVAEACAVVACRRYDMDLRDERELALQRLRILCHSGLFSILDFR